MATQELRQKPTEMNGERWGLEKDSVRQACDAPRLMPGSGVPGSQNEDGFGAEPVGNTEFQGQNLCKKLVGWDYVYWNMVKE